VPRPGGPTPRDIADPCLRRRGVGARFARPPRPGRGGGSAVRACRQVECHFCRRRDIGDPHANIGISVFSAGMGQAQLEPGRPVADKRQRCPASDGPGRGELDASFFRVFDRLTPSEKRYLRAMAELGPGTHRSGNIADRPGRRITAVAPIRSTLIAKGMIYSPAHGGTAFTVPLFDGFMKRTMPEWN